MSELWTCTELTCPYHGRENLACRTAGDGSAGHHPYDHDPDYCRLHHVHSCLECFA